MKKNPVVCMVGLGYIGLPTALLLAQGGVHVVGFDVDAKKLAKLQSGKLPFEENGLTELFKNVRKGDFFSVSATIPSCDVYIVAVPTPQIDGTADLTYVYSAFDLIETRIPKGAIVVLESTVGPMDCEQHLLPRVKLWNKDIGFVHCPERAIPGNTLYEMIHNDRIIGAAGKKEATYIESIYRHFVQGEIVHTTPTIAAACKVMENTYRAVNIALANEYAQLAELLQFDVWEAIAIANRHPRVAIHSPGPGVGGHCIPIDPWYFTQYLPSQSLIETALRKNQKMTHYIVKELKKYFTQLSLTSPTIGILGYAYKKNIDDYRETPAEPLRDELSKYFEVHVTDPYVVHEKVEKEEKVLQSSQVWVIVTDHDRYTKIDLSKYPNLVCIYDTRNSLTSKQLRSFKGHYKILGKE